MNTLDAVEHKKRSSLIVPGPASSGSKKRWSALIPRPGSSSGGGGLFRRPGSSGGHGEQSAPAQAPVPTPGNSSGGGDLFRQPGSTSGHGEQSAPAPILRPGSSSGGGLFRRPRSSGGLSYNGEHSAPAPVSRPSSSHSLTSLSKANDNGQDQGKTYFFPSILGLPSLSLSRTSTRDSSTTDERDRGRSEPVSRSQSRTRSQSPFSFRRFTRHRDSSPTAPPLPLSQSDADLSDAASSIHPRNTAFSDDESADDINGDPDPDSSTDEFIDPLTEQNTEKNAVIPPIDSIAGAAEIEDADPVGEGVNIIVALDPYFPTSDLGSGARGKRNTRKRKAVKGLDPLLFHTARPVFQRDRCTISITQGDPAGKLGGRKKRRYVVASDLSEESRYAVEWGIGTVLRDGDEMWIVTVIENESKIDPDMPNNTDKTQKLRSQQERQGLAYILARQVTGLLQRTRLNVTILCQAWHAKHSRHMLLDIVDYIEPIMLIVGSRGLGRLNGILLGSTSHYLIQKCSVPVMVARRRLKRPPKKSAHLSTQRARVKLADAGIDRVAAKVDQDVKVMRDEMQRDDSRRDGGPGSRETRGFSGIPEGGLEDEAEDEQDDEPAGIKVSG